MLHLLDVVSSSYPSDHIVFAQASRQLALPVVKGGAEHLVLPLLVSSDLMSHLPGYRVDAFYLSLFAFSGATAEQTYLNHLADKSCRKKLHQVTTSRDGQMALLGDAWKVVESIREGQVPSYFANGFSDLRFPTRKEVCAYIEALSPETVPSRVLRAYRLMCNKL